jgi:hypothetical protein
MQRTISFVYHLVSGDASNTFTLNFGWREKGGKMLTATYSYYQTGKSYEIINCASPVGLEHTTYMDLVMQQTIHHRATMPWWILLSCFLNVNKKLCSTLTSKYILFISSFLLIHNTVSIHLTALCFTETFGLPMTCRPLTETQGCLIIMGNGSDHSFYGQKCP